DSVGYRFGNAAYVTDVKDILMEKNRSVLEGLDTLIIDGLREKPHLAHYSFQEALEIGEELGAKRIFFTHMNHETSHVAIEGKYGKRAHAAYDTLVVEVAN
ncbi:MAG: MBL fold metallo-hydrolase, partial [Spirochaetales bacterium]|nr:MBL fold metallo-hydrolase [Candidatus Physcosoma equi]